MTTEAVLLKTIRQLTHEDMARLWRFAPAAHPYFTTPRVAAAFAARFRGLGGMTPAMSKHLDKLEATTDELWDDRLGPLSEGVSNG